MRSCVELNNELNKNTMRYRPKRENYAVGQFGEIDYQEMLERYCTYLENQNKQLRIGGVVKSLPCKEVKGFKLNKMLQAYKTICKPDVNFEKYYSKGFTECWEWLNSLNK